jgi:hypothetical protein
MLRGGAWFSFRPFSLAMSVHMYRKVSGLALSWFARIGVFLAFKWWDRVIWPVLPSI